MFIIIVKHCLLNKNGCGILSCVEKKASFIYLSEKAVFDALLAFWGREIQCM